MPAAELEAAVDTVIDVREVYLDAALGAAIAEFGSIDRYLEVAAGLDVQRRERLREALLV
jgi:protein tyrosine/serine phosphatase